MGDNRNVHGRGRALVPAGLEDGDELVQAASMGLGIQGLKVEGGDAEEIVRKALNIPDLFHVLGMTPLGIPARTRQSSRTGGRIRTLSRYSILTTDN